VADVFSFHNGVSGRPSFITTERASQSRLQYEVKLGPLDPVWGGSLGLLETGPVRDVPLSYPIHEPWLSGITDELPGLLGNDPSGLLERNSGSHEGVRGVWEDLLGAFVDLFSISPDDAPNPFLQASPSRCDGAKTFLPPDQESGLSYCAGTPGFDSVPASEQGCHGRDIVTHDGGGVRRNSEPEVIRTDVHGHARAYLCTSGAGDPVEHLLGASYDHRNLTWPDIFNLQHQLLNICYDALLRDKACALEGARAAQLSDLIHHVSHLCPCLAVSTDMTPQQCLAHAPSYSSPDLLRLLQDICSRSGELPSSYMYWLDNIGVHWRDYIARGGEACIYPGTLGNCKVVIREVSKPGNAPWTSPAGQQVITVGTNRCGAASGSGSNLSCS